MAALPKWHNNGIPTSKEDTPMQNETDAQAAWERFSRTGAVGAYLTYRAIRAHEEHAGQHP